MQPGPSRLDGFAGDVTDETVDRKALIPLLERIAEQESALVDRFYDAFFEARPDVVPLFGLYAIAEKEEMIRETLRSLFAWSEEEEWLRGNLLALGSSHAEYGVEDDMYPPFVMVLSDCIEAVLRDSGGAPATAAELGAMTAGLREISETMCLGAAEAC